MRYVSAKDEKQKRMIDNLLGLFGQDKEPVTIRRDGEDVAVLLPPEEFARYEAFKKRQAQDFLDACDALAAEAAAKGLTEEKLAEILND